MKWLITTIAAAVLSTILVAPAFAEHSNRYNSGLSQHQAVKQVMRSFNKIDRNHNGYVSRKEVRRYERNHHNRGYERRTSYRSDRYNKNSQTITSRNFRKFDRNQDGHIKKKEAKRAVKRRFERADRNRDGYLSKREINRSGWYDVDYGYDRNDRYRDRNDRDHRR